MEYKKISTQALRRLPTYLRFLRSLPTEGSANISATTLAGELRLNDVQVRKDLALVSGNGRPKTGYVIKNLIRDIEHCLGYDNVGSAVLIGVGNLGRALLAYEGFSEYGLDIIMAFDEEEEVVGSSLYGRKVMPLDKLSNLCTRMKIKIGIITTGGAQAQQICDLLVANGIVGIWNFAPTHLNVPDQVLVQNENLASSFAVLSKHLTEKLNIQRN